jgi:outer membrane protein assembly factor BamB
MARARLSLVFAGIKHHVVAFDRRTGAEVWRQALPAKYRTSGSLVAVLRDAEGLFATCAGELFSLDPRTGTVLWHAPMKGLGTGFITVATDLGASTDPTVMAAAAMAQAAATTAATTAAI